MSDLKVKCNIMACLIGKEFNTQVAILDDEGNLLVKKRDGCINNSFSLKYIPKYMNWKMIKSIVENSIVDRECAICYEVVTSALVTCGRCKNYYCVDCLNKKENMNCPFCRNEAKGIIVDDETKKQYF